MKYAKILLLTIVLIAFIIPANAGPLVSCGKRLLAYYSPDSNTSYKQNKIPYSQLTHICQAFMTFTASGAVSGPTVETGFITNAHAEGVKVLVSVGGSGYAATFSTLMNNATARTTLINNIYNFCATNNYDGADIDWEYPKSNADKANMTTFIIDLRAKFNSSPAPAPTWLISAAIPGYETGTNFIDFVALNSYIDFWNVMAYDMHGSWSLDKPGPNSALYQGSDPNNTTLNCVSYMDTIINTRGVAASKINMGMPFYGYNFPSATGLYTASITSDALALAYTDIIPLITNGSYTYVWDSGSHTPYLRKNVGNGVITYDNQQSIVDKVNYAVGTRNAGGVFMWRIDQGYNTTSSTQPLLQSMYDTLIAYCPGTPTNTSTNTNTMTPTNTPSATRTVTMTPTNTRTFTVTQTRTNTPLVTNTFTPTATFTFTSTPTPSSTVVVTSGELKIYDIVGYPNPCFPGIGTGFNIVFNVTSPHVSERISIYTISFRKIKEITQTGTYDYKSNKVSVPAVDIGTLSSGIYFYVVKVTDSAGREVSSKIKIFSIIR